MIFISHKFIPDHKLALEFKKKLNSLGIDTWIAPENVSIGKCYAEEIPHALRKCEKVLFVFTKASMKSRHIIKELDLANRYNKEIIPVQIGDFQLSDEFEYLLAGVQIKRWHNDDKDEIISQLISDAHVYEIKTHHTPPHKITLIRGDFQDNLDYVISEKLLNFNKTVIAMGIDRTGNLSISSTKGIIKYVCQYLFDKFGYHISQLQHYVDQAKMEQLKHTSNKDLMQFGDSIIVKVPINLPDVDFLQFLFIANSEKGTLFSQTHDLDDVNGIDSREIVLKVFNRCVELGEQAETLFIGAMGTNGLSFPYEVITSEIMNAFVYSTKVGKSPTHLIFSVRNIDMKNAGVTSQSIYNYVRNVVSFFE